VVVKKYLTHEELKDICEQEWFQDEQKSALFAACCGSSNIHGKLVKLHFEHGAPLVPRDNLSNDELKELHGGDVLDLLRLKPTLMHIAAQFGSGETENLKRKTFEY
jgi:hypothetical protein